LSTSSTTRRPAAVDDENDSTKAAKLRAAQAENAHAERKQAASQ
jgi:hypothetical protein